MISAPCCVTQWMMFSALSSINMCAVHMYAVRPKLLCAFGHLIFRSSSFPCSLFCLFHHFFSIQSVSHSFLFRFMTWIEISLGPNKNHHTFSGCNTHGSRRHSYCGSLQGHHRQVWACADRFVLWREGLLLSALPAWIRVACQLNDCARNQGTSLTYWLDFLLLDLTWHALCWLELTRMPSKRCRRTDKNCELAGNQVMARSRLVVNILMNVMCDVM